MAKIGYVILLAGLAGVTWQACKTNTTAPDGVLLTGVWGSAQGRLTATQVSTQFNGSCGAGNTNQPILLDKKGRFEILGIYGANGSAQTAARFMGAIGEKTITLRVMRADSTEMVPPVVMHLGQQ